MLKLSRQKGEIVDWVTETLNLIRERACPACEKALKNCRMSEITSDRRLQKLSVRIICSNCREKFEIFITTKRAQQIRRPVSLDEVLDAYEILKDWHGSVRDLLERIES